ncbi:type II CAAX endopeptidase family protein [Kangiella marina]|uniref:CAAX prenyl protease 2/Lysostaphin resistance protein A-like domain-containing protein n=1 Tax=Kangiella marina TaxID=1079178 RepID=A0ABP8INK4_9GAMM
MLASSTDAKKQDVTVNRVQPNNIQTISKSRWFATLGLGSLLFAIALFASHSYPSIFLDLPMSGFTFAYVAPVFLILTLLAVFLSLKLVNYNFSDIGLSFRAFGKEALIGLLVASAWTLLQFFVIIPATGGAERMDIVANLEQLGTDYAGLFAFLLMAILGGGIAEEVFFRGFFLTSLRNSFGNSQVATALAVIITTIVFALLHGYQGWIGILDTAVFGGLSMSLLYLWRKNLTACIVAHGLYDVFAVLILFFYF